MTARYGLTVQTVRRRQRLRSLTPALRGAFDGGTITASVAEAASRLPEREQQMLAARLAGRGRLSLSEVHDVTRKRTDEAKSELPDELFSDREVAWQATARGHIVAALEVTAPDQHNGPLTQLVERALTEVEQV